MPQNPITRAEAVKIIDKQDSLFETAEKHNRNNGNFMRKTYI
jgi:hypothetical protein